MKLPKTPGMFAAFGQKGAVTAIYDLIVKDIAALQQIYIEPPPIKLLIVPMRDSLGATCTKPAQVLHRPSAYKTRQRTKQTQQETHSCLSYPLHFMQYIFDESHLKAFGLGRLLALTT